MTNKYTKKWSTFLAIRKMQLNTTLSLGMVANTCNPSYLGEGDLENWGLKPAWAKISGNFISTNKCWVWYGTLAVPSKQEA
jgi:hypothetical protein